MAVNKRELPNRRPMSYQTGALVVSSLNVQLVESCGIFLGRFERGHITNGRGEGGGVNMAELA